MDSSLAQALESVEEAFRTCKPFIQINEALVLYNAVIELSAALADKTN